MNEKHILPMALLIAIITVAVLGAAFGAGTVAFVVAVLSKVVFWAV